MNKRPIHINPLAIKLPITALVSIGHRISGILVFLLIPLLLWMLAQSLASPEGFNQVKEHFQGTPIIYKFMLWLLLAGLIFHLVAGLRHLLMDIHLGDSHKAGRLGATFVLISAAFFILAATYWMWR